jgi:nucleoside-diphosphate-sugar epimerase
MGAGAVATEDPNRIRPANSEVERLFSDNTKAKTVLGWEPEIKGVEGFRDGLAKTIEWFTEPANLAKYRPDEYTV